MAKNNEINNSAEEYKLLVSAKRYLLMNIVLIFISMSLLGFIIYLKNENTALGSISLSLAIAFLTASLVDIFFNKMAKENMEQLSAKQLMLSKEVQNEILKNNKIEDILDCALESTLGPDLKDAINKSLIKRLYGYKNATRVNGSLSIVLKNLDNGSDYFRKNFYHVENMTKYSEILTKDRITFIYTDDNDLFDKESEVRGEKREH